MQTFVSVYKYDPVRILFFNRVLPVVVWISLCGAVLFPVLILGSLWSATSGADRERLVLLTAALTGLLLIGPGLMAWVVRQNRRELFETLYRADAAGIEKRKGTRTWYCRWGEIDSIRTIGIGRVQLARVDYAGGRFWFDGAVVEEAVPPPRLKWSMSGTTIEYADGRSRGLGIRESELFQLISGRVRRGG
jgi:hypothetical protein